MYTEYYGLNTQPFRLTPDPFFFFNSTTHKSALAYLRYGMQLGEGFIVVTGGAGTGKTTLSLALLGSLSRSEMVIGELVTTQLQDEDLLRSIASAFKLDSRGTKSDLIQSLQEFFSARARAGKKVLLVVDEAHNLPHSSFEELRMLSNFHRGPQALLQCILLGQQPLRDILIQSSMEQFQQRIIATHHLHPLSPDETREYILHRLQQAGWRGDPSFTGESVHRIYQYTRGVPRLINMFCNRILLFGYIEEKHQIDASATIQVYNEWEQELGHIGSVESVQQSQLSEINTAGITQEHITLRHAVGADSPSFSKPTKSDDNKVILINRHDAHENNLLKNTSTVVRHDSSVKSPSMGEYGGMDSNNPRVDYSQASLSDRIFEILFRMFSDKNTSSAPFSPPLSLKSTLILPLAVLVVALLIMTMLFPVNNSEKKTASINVGHQLTNQAALSSEQLVWIKSFNPVTPRFPVVADDRAQLQGGTQQPEKSVIPSRRTKNTLPLTLNMVKDNAELTREKPLQKIDERKMTESEFSALITQPDSNLIDETTINDKKSAKDINRRDQNSSITMTDSKTKVKPELKHAAKKRQSAHKYELKLEKTRITETSSKTIKSTSSDKVARKSLTVPAAQGNMIASDPGTAEHEEGKVLHESNISNKFVKIKPEKKANRKLSKTTPQLNPADSVKGSITRLQQQSASAETNALVESSSSDSSKNAEPSKGLPISKEQLAVLMNIFRWAYDVGDLDTLVQLFSDDVHSDEGVNRQDIEISYQKLFNVTEERHLVLNDLQWSGVGDAVQGKGNFAVMVKERGRNWVSSYRGKITLRVVKHDNQLLITTLHHSYTR